MVAKYHDGGSHMTSFFSDLLLTIGERGRSFVDWHQASSDEKDLVGIAEALLSQKGEASGLALASEFFSVYDGLDDAELDVFFNVLAERFGPDLDELEKLNIDFHDSLSRETVIAFHRVAEPRRQELFRRLNQAPDGTLRLVRLREDLLDRLPGNPKLVEVDVDFHHLFLSWFNRGFLMLKRITWSTPASILEKIIKYEAVHEIGSWEELRRRIEPEDRRCYAFFHPALAEEPLIFVEVALTDGIPDAIEPIIAPERPTLSVDTAKLATFYSISNCQRGLTGVSFGSFLIKQVVERLHQELPHLGSFITLSPVPGFRSWLDHLSKGATGGPILTKADQATINELSTANRIDDDAKSVTIKKILFPLIAWYLLHAKDGHNKPLDPVARFHLGNGARLERINWLADRSDKCIGQSAGIMVNYLYDLGDIEKNHEAFANQDRVIAANVITRLVKNSSSSKSMEKTL
jgi:malonyl-CoA decarboxylase